MLIKRWHKTRKCYVWDIRLIDEHGKKRLYSTGHTSKKVAAQYEHTLRNEIAERKMFPDKFFERRIFRDFVVKSAPPRTPNPLHLEHPIR
ncbi:MAG TPA: hypothetical protein PLX02_07160 [Syntrophorhabdaceae bacterium]|nr:hypothetical protein [Syntrophorhabdaceae bacterium]HQM81384.1 hypothetical protein [Syntrophorhabdaceae bacterium]